MSFKHFGVLLIYITINAMSTILNCCEGGNPTVPSF